MDQGENHRSFNFHESILRSSFCIAHWFVREVQNSSFFRRHGDLRRDRSFSASFLVSNVHVNRVTHRYYMYSIHWYVRKKWGGRTKVKFLKLWQVYHFMLWGFFKFIATKEPNSGNFMHIFSRNNCSEKIFA